MYVTYVGMCARMYVRMDGWMHGCMDGWIIIFCTDTCMHMHMHNCMCVYTYLYTHTIVFYKQADRHAAACLSSYLFIDQPPLSVCMNIHSDVLVC